MGKRLLIITRHRLNENNGGANASKGIIHCFAALFDECSLIYPSFDETAAYIPPKCHLYPCHDCRCNIQKGLDCYIGKLSPLANFTKKHLKKYHYDVIVIDHSFIAGSLIHAAKRTGAKVITIHHNVERNYLHDNRQQFSITYRLPYIYFARLAEKKCLCYSDINLTLTECDAVEFSKWYRRKNLHLHSWGIFEYRPIADRVFTTRKRDLTFAITGSLCFMQSLYPILEFIQRYWPLVLNVYPTARLLIAGRNPAPILQTECERHQNICIIPNPKEIANVIQEADYYICPINTGSGLKLRILDGLKQGLPVLTHQVAIAGYESLADKKCVFSYHDEETFLNSLRQMIVTNTSSTTIYQAYKATFSLETGLKRLHHILKQENITTTHI